MRKALDELEEAEGKKYLLTSAFGCGKSTIDAAYDVPAIAPCVKNLFPFF